MLLAMSAPATICCAAAAGEAPDRCPVAGDEAPPCHGGSSDDEPAEPRPCENEPCDAFALMGPACQARSGPGEAVQAAAPTLPTTTLALPPRLPDAAAPATYFDGHARPAAPADDPPAGPCTTLLAQACQLTL